MGITTKITTTVAGLLLATVALTGCVTVEDSPRAKERPAPSTSTASAGSPDAAAATESPEHTKTQKHSLIVDLSPAQGTSYVLANKPGGMLSPSKVIGPWLLQWVVDGDKVTYREVLCTGTAAREATGTLEGSGSEQVVKWTAGDDPWVGNAPTETTRATVTDTSMRVGFLETATTDVAGEKAKFLSYCKQAGEDVAQHFK